MRAWCVALIRAGMVLALGLGSVSGVAAQTARAVILEDVVVDGRLDEWPDSLQRHPVLNEFQAYGRTDLAGADLRHGEDLSGAFRVGYDPGTDLLYLAVEVRDDILAVGTGHRNTDACEVYVHARPPDALDGHGTPLQYAMVPADGGAFDLGWPNPGLAGGEIGRTRTQGAFSRHGDITTYEWALEVFERYPHQRLRLEPGRRLGFDVVLVDRDESGASAWVPWGPPVVQKAGSSARLGTLALADRAGAVLPALGPERMVMQPQQFERDMEEFGRDMERLGESMAELATGMAGASLERLVGELEQLEGLDEQQLDSVVEGLSRAQALDRRERSQLRASLAEAQRELAAARQRLAARHHPSRSAVVESIVDAVLAIAIILSIAAAIGMVVYLARRGGQRLPPASVDELGARLEGIEQRLRDTQEVMLGLSAKHDRMAAAQPGREPHKE